MRINSGETELHCAWQRIMIKDAWQSVQPSLLLYVYLSFSALRVLNMDSNMYLYPQTRAFLRPARAVARGSVHVCTFGPQLCALGGAVQTPTAPLPTALSE